MNVTELKKIEAALNDTGMADCTALQHDTIVAVARQHALNLGDRKYITWLDNGKTESDSYSFAALDRQARSLAVQLQALVHSRQHNHGQADYPAALILTQPGLEFVKAFFACLYAGIVAVPTYPLKRGETSQRLSVLVENSRASMVLADSKSYAQIAQFPDVCMQAPLVRLDDLSPDLHENWKFPDIDSQSPAFYQYTSGSTGQSKGVIVTHGNLMSNERVIAEAMGHDSDTVVVGWLPLFHDMGLIGNLLQPFCLGASCYLMSPLAFIANPVRWLQAISKYRATSSGGPNFAYDLCIARTTAEQRAELDLSHWQVAFNGSEPIRAATLDRFSQTFAGCGFNRSAFFPCYGMAESTLLVTGSSPYQLPAVLTVDKRELELGKVQPLATIHSTATQTGNAEIEVSAPQTVQLVSSGKTYQDCQVRIVHPETCVALPAQHVGEIWVRGSSVANGYKDNDHLTDRTFKARLAEADQSDTYLRTGDLGFLYKGELFVTGRHKDLIIINGRNHYPQDLEQTVIQAHPALADCRVAAFGIDVDTQERLVVVASIGKKIANNIPVQEIRDSVAEVITRRHGLKLQALVFTTSRLPETSSGKLQRSRCRQMYQNGEFETRRL
ncbi:MAG: fatty acyl-AMP ligase [Burkholderiales bacterium]|nr:fatty acyl-AMP ligase [Burkholderiales bacterium]MDR4517414.1 fatty acyl-AMP ligase [Nitrosomonas sp.]